MTAGANVAADVPAQLRHLTADLAQVVAGFHAALASLGGEAAAIADFPGVRRLSSSALVVSTATLHARGHGSWDARRVDAPAQARQLVAIVEEALVHPIGTRERLEAILADGVCVLRGDRLTPRKAYFDPELVAHFRPAIEAASALAVAAASLQPGPSRAAAPVRAPRL